jgi:hypothetical protein
MRIKITKSDGTVIEAEGTAEECATFVHRDVSTNGQRSGPFVSPPLTWPETPSRPWWGVGEPDRYWRPYEVTCGGIATSSLRLTTSSEVA